MDGYFANFTSGPEKPTIDPTLIQHILEMDIIIHQEINSQFYLPFQTITSMATHL